MQTSLDHEYYMRMAVRRALAAREQNEVPTGCVIVHCPDQAGGAPPRVVAQAHNQVELLKDATAHAEMIALTQASAAIGDRRLAGTVLYVTKEPCVMCAGAIVLARVPTVVFGATDPRRGGVVSAFNILDCPSLNHRCRVIPGVLADECASLLQDFFRERR